MSSAIKSIPIPEFDGTASKWPIFKQRMKGAMQVRGLWIYIDPLSQISVGPVAEKKEEDIQREMKTVMENKIIALACLTHALPDQLMSAYASELVTDPRTVWESLCTHFESATMMNKSHLRTKLSQSRMKSDQSYLEYHTEIMEIVRALKGMNEPVSDAEIVHHLLRGLSLALAHIPINCRSLSTLMFPLDRSLLVCISRK
jgi:hypothetical protein